MKIYGPLVDQTVNQLINLLAAGEAYLKAKTAAVSISNVEMEELTRAKKALVTKEQQLRTLQSRLARLEKPAAHTQRRERPAEATPGPFNGIRGLPAPDNAAE